MNTNKYPIIGALIPLAGVPALFWLSGFNFDERSPMLALCACFTIVWCACGAAVGDVIRKETQGRK